MRLVIEVAQKLRKVWPADKPLFIRISAVDWAEGPEKDENGKYLQWGVEQSIVLAKRLQEIGVDLVDVSTGGLWAAQKITVGPGYQASNCKILFSIRLRRSLYL
jgi:2,4-dienoyl-CoA reductase-like NADH-dependent reductase (Old Yellow Enzyme family)